jgi:tripartite ATP-independent transporter DctM subunit
MSWAIATVFVLIFLLLALRVPVAIALLAPTVLFILLFDLPILLVAQNMSRTLFSFTLLTVPLFIFVGSLMNNSGMTDRMFDFASTVVGHRQGGLAQVNIFASLIFSGMSGSAMADIGGIGKVLIQTMEESGYRSGFSAAITGASSTVGPIFPPSIPLIIYGVLAEVSVLDLLLAGIGPALVSVAALAVITAGLARSRDMPTMERSSWSVVLRATRKAIPALLAPVILVGGMLAGIFGPSEVAAVAAVYVVLVNVAVYREFEVGYIWTSALETIRTTAIVLFILMAASLFGWIVSYERVPGLVGDLLLSVTTDTLVLLVLMNLVLLVIGLFLEPLSALVMAIPVFVPPLTGLGVDPVHLGVIMVLNLMVGLLTPPIGLSLYLTSDLSGASVESIVSELRPYYVTLLLVLLLVTLVPQIALFAPNL